MAGQVFLIPGSSGMAGATAILSGQAGNAVFIVGMNESECSDLDAELP